MIPSTVTMVHNTVTLNQGYALSLSDGIASLYNNLFWKNNNNGLEDIVLRTDGGSFIAKDNVMDGEYTMLGERADVTNAMSLDMLFPIFNSIHETPDVPSYLPDQNQQVADFRLIPEVLEESTLTALSTDIIPAFVWSGAMVKAPKSDIAGIERLAGQAVVGAYQLMPQQ